MKNYRIYVDGYTIGEMELTPAEAQQLEKEEGIAIESV